MYPMTRVEIEKFEETLGRHLAVFQKKGGPLGRTDLAQHKIEKGDTKPMRQRARRLVLLMREEVSSQRVSGLRQWSWYARRTGVCGSESTTTNSMQSQPRTLILFRG